MLQATLQYLAEYFLHVYERVLSFFVSVLYELQLSYSSLIFVTFIVVINSYLVCFPPPQFLLFLCFSFCSHF
jgi:hypothetical protein